MAVEVGGVNSIGSPRGDSLRCSAAVDEAGRIGAFRCSPLDWWSTENGLCDIFVVQPDVAS